MPIELSAAIDEHRLGRLEQASRVYEAALIEDPDRHQALHLLGLATLQRGDANHAARLIERAVALSPHEASYHASLAEAFWALRRLDRAVDCCRTALRLKPGNPEVLCNLGATLVDQGKLEEAIGCFRDALRVDFDLGVAHHNLGNALRLKGEKAEALEEFRWAVRLLPDNADVRNSLGQSLLERGDLNEALSHLLQSVRVRPTFALALTNLGSTLRELGRLEEARACFREALRSQPGSTTAHVGMGGVSEDLGERDQAVASFREALRHDPRHAGALTRLATLLRDELPENDHAAIEELLADSTLIPERRMPLLFGLAQTLDARGEFERAAELTLQANALRLAELKKQGRGYDPNAHHEFVDRLLEAFTPEFFTRVGAWGLETERPVFVVGMPRSGTTLIEQILASHRRVFGAGELRLGRETFEAIPKAPAPRATLRERLQNLDRDETRRLGQRHLDAIETINGLADRVVDKMPENLLYLGMLATIFPRAKLIHCRRDLRDVALSCWMTNFTHLRWACDPGHIASRCAEYQRVLDHWRRVLPTPILDVDYETMVADPESVSRAMVAWCGLEWDPACLEFHKTRRAVRTPSSARVRMPVYRGSVARWKNYEQSLAPLFRELTGES